MHDLISPFETHQIPIQGESGADSGPDKKTDRGAEPGGECLRDTKCGQSQKHPSEKVLKVLQGVGRVVGEARSTDEPEGWQRAPKPCVES